MLILLYGVVVIIGFALLIVYLKEILDILTKRGNRIRTFIWENKTLIDINFLIIYSIIQLIFIYKITNPIVDINLLISIYILVLLTVMGIERLFLRSRFNYLNEMTSDIIKDYFLLEKDYYTTIKREKRLIRYIKNSKI